MGKIKLKSTLAAGAATLMLCLGNIKDSTLKDVARAYLGEYECSYARLGDKEYLEGFDFVRLELKKDGTYRLTFKEKTGKKHAETGRYEYDESAKKLRFCPREDSAFKKEFPLVDGVLTVTAQIGNQQLIVCFTQK